MRRARRHAPPILALVLSLGATLALRAPPAAAQGGTRTPPPTAGDDRLPRPATDSAARRDSVPLRPVPEKPPVVTHHVATVGGETFRYTATTGLMPIRNERSGVTEGHIFYVYYSRDAANPATRPLTFVFNGGPGSATVWLHMGAYGPKRVHLNPDGTNPPPPYTYEDNPFTLLNQTDLVFLDPVGTGYSRAARPELGSVFWGLDEDVRSVGEFIRLFLVTNKRWGSPKFVSGESYGTTRAAHLSGWLADNGIALNGVVLLSAVLNFQASRQAHGNDLAWMGYFPTYVATAWYHKRLPPDLQSQPLAAVLAQAEQWTDGAYLHALHAGARLSDGERQQAITQMARLSGLSRGFVDDNDLRVSLPRFDHELLRDRRLVVGRLDGRFTAYSQDPAAERGSFDPSDASIRNSFTPVLNDYVRRELNYQSEDVYYILGGGIGPWRYPTEPQGYPDVTPGLERAFAKNPAMRLFVAMGYYDGATPYWAVEYTLNHLNIAPAMRQNISTDHFTAGHMMYIDDPSMRKLRADLTRFFADALRPAPSAVAP
ncbi:MAG: peptidase serine carboxypeptidase [Gemmatimonadetes bacterium]|jgi:carboxypeptidase C (cathepsin A)|nr:peptidase serine carboxypeptidase [Gemmatimonadota bacterium]